MGIRKYSVLAQECVSGVGALLPGYRIPVDLQELEDVLGFFPVFGFLLGC